jgi:phenylacetate-CoA ligase
MTGRALADGQRGELVVTTLTREGLPLVRYRTRDITRIRSRERCECGRTGVRLDRFQGRSDDMVIFKGVNFYPSQIEQILLRQPGLDHEYQIVLDRDAGRGDHLVLCVEAGPAFDQSAQARLLRELADRMSLTPEIRRMAPGEIPRPAGKAVRVVDRRSSAG